MTARTPRGRTVPLPGPLRRRGPEPGGYGYAILGAGCAGLSLCHYLLKRGVEAPILIVNPKEAFTDDRTWCFWDVEGTPSSSRAVRSWDSWTVPAEGWEVVHTSDRYPYLCLTGADFYEEALQKISTRGNVAVRLGEVVQTNARGARRWGACGNLRGLLPRGQRARRARPAA